MPILVPFLVAGALLVSSVMAHAVVRGGVLAAMAMRELVSEPAAEDQCFRYVSRPGDTLEVLWRRIR